MDSLSPYWPFPLFPIVFVLMWLAILAFLSMLGGWIWLARRYPVPVPSAAVHKSFLWRSGRLGIVNYSGCLTFKATTDGLLVSVPLMFRVAHPEFFVPWAEFSGKAARSFFIFRVVKFKFRRSPNVTLEISHRLADRLAQESGGKLLIKP